MIKIFYLTFFIVFCVSSTTQSNEILNCPSCVMEKEFCKNCKKAKKLEKYKKINPDIKTVKSKEFNSTSKVSDFLVCYRYGHHFGKYVKEAELRNLKCNNENNLKKKSFINPISKKTLNAEKNV